MQKTIIKPWLFLASFCLLGGLGLTVTSCGDDEPDPIPATANFTFVVNPDKSGSVAFTNTSVNGKQYAWDFGDGTTSTEESPTHVYTASDVYDVELTALGENGTTPSKKMQEVDVIKEAVNLLEGGKFETADASKWTIVGTGADLLPKVEFGVTANLPDGGSGGGFRVSNPDALVTGKKVEMVMYRSIALVAGKTYTVSALIKHGPLTATDVVDGGPKEVFLSLEIANAAPSGTGQWKNIDNSDAAVLIHRYCVCWMSTTSPAANGPWVNAYTVSWINYFTGAAGVSPKNGAILEFSVPTSGTYYVGFKAGLGTATGATFSNNGFVVDNVVISEK